MSAVSGRAKLEADVVIVGGAAIGSAAALALRREDPRLRVTVLEPDPTYREAASVQANGGIRQLFSLTANVRLSQYTLEVLDLPAHFFGGEASAVDLGWERAGYLFLAGAGEESLLGRQAETWCALGVDARWLEPDALRRRYPWLRTEDLSGAVLSPDDGWFDPPRFLRLLRQAAIAEGATYLTERATTFEFSSDGVAVRTESRGMVQAGKVINAAGCWAPELSRMAGMPLPVEPMRRYHHYVEAPVPFERFPFLKDFSGLAIQWTRGGLVVGKVDFDAPGGFDSPDDPDYFQNRVWGPLAHRIPALDRCRLRHTGTGFYDQNRFDGNAIIGNWPGVQDRHYVACGFSGHGLMHAPGVGRGLAELVVHDVFQTLDLGELSYSRILAGTPAREVGIR